MRPRVCGYSRIRLTSRPNYLNSSDWPTENLALDGPRASHGQSEFDSRQRPFASRYYLTATSLVPVPHREASFRTRSAMPTSGRVNDRHGKEVATLLES